jgi:hypothetical protein
MKVVEGKRADYLTTIMAYAFGAFCVVGWVYGFYIA